MWSFVDLCGFRCTPHGLCLFRFPSLETSMPCFGSILCCLSSRISLVPCFLLTAKRWEAVVLGRRGFPRRVARWIWTWTCLRSTGIGIDTSGGQPKTSYQVGVFGFISWPIVISICFLRVGYAERAKNKSIASRNSIEIDKTRNQRVVLMRTEPSSIWQTVYVSKHDYVQIEVFCFLNSLFFSLLCSSL